MRPKTAAPVLLLMIWLLLATPRSGIAQSADPVPGVRVESTVLTARFVDGSMAVDGHLDEPAWKEADVVDDFLQFEPLEGAPATQRTEVRVLYGPTSLFIGATLFDEEPGRIQQTLGRRDEYVQADWFAVSIDSRLDRRTAYVFAVSAAGVQYDALRTEGGSSRQGPGGGGDVSWDAIWHSAVRVTSHGWSVEMEIPYSMLRFPRAAMQTWGIHFAREIPRLGEKSEWPLVPRTERANLVAQFGRLQGLTGIEPRRNVQITPYTLSRLQTAESTDRPGTVVRNESVDVGVDMLLGLGSDVTFNATINPDFGQVESDPAELNLTAFETFFPERRPFFVEGSQNYGFSLIGPGSSLLYTRRIGAQAPIIGATKLSGRTERGLSFGLLGASTGHDLQPDRHFGVARVSQQIGSFSTAGAMLTGFEGPSVDGRRRALTGGADWDLRFGDNAYSLQGFTAFTHGTRMNAGTTGQLLFSRRQGTWTYTMGGDYVDDHFDPNDLGRQQRNNFAGAVVRLGHEINGGHPFGPFQRAQAGGFVFRQVAYRGGLDLGGRLGLNSTWTLHSFESIRLSLSLIDFFGGYDLFETRGLWPSAKRAAVQTDLSYATDDRREWRIRPQLDVAFRDDRGRVYATGVDATWNIRSRLSLAGDVAFEWENGAVEWSSNETFRRRAHGWEIGAVSRAPDRLTSDQFVPVDDAARLDAIFDGMQPYDPQGNYFVPVFGARDTRTLDVTLRTNYTFTPSLSLQFYSQLFVARARYDQFSILRDRDTRVAFDGFPKRNEISRRSFQFNTVLRWEYRPGSVLYLVWTQQRRADDALNPLAPWGPSPYERPLSSHISDTFGLFPGNVFLLKLTYTFLN